MGIQVKKIEVFQGTMPDQPGALDNLLGTLAAAGANLDCIIARRQPDQPGQGHVYLTPVKGKNVLAAARSVGLAPAPSIATLRVETANKAGVGHRIMAAVAAAGINVRGISMIALGTKALAFIGFDSAADADAAIKAIKAADRKK